MSDADPNIPIAANDASAAGVGAQPKAIRIDGKLLRPVDMFKTLVVGVSGPPEHPVYDSFTQLAAAMLFPHDPAGQVLYQKEELVSKRCLGGKGLPNSLSALIAQPMQDGITAGLSLLYFHALRTGTFRTKSGRKAPASQNIVLHACESYNLGRKKYGRGHPLGSEERSAHDRALTRGSIEAVWENYQRVSHLWAAYLHLRRLPIHKRDLTNLVEQVSVSVMLPIAQQYESVADQFFVGEKRDPNEPASSIAFRVEYADWPPADPIEIPLPSKPDYVLASLDAATKAYFST